MFRKLPKNEKVQKIPQYRFNHHNKNTLPFGTWALPQRSHINGNVISIVVDIPGKQINIHWTTISVNRNLEKEPIYNKKESRMEL